MVELPKNPIGFSTIAGLFGVAAAGVTTIVNSLEHNQALLTGANKPAGVIAFVLLGVTVLKRGLEAAHLYKAAALASAAETAALSGAKQAEELKAAA